MIYNFLLKYFFSYNHLTYLYNITSYIYKINKKDWKVWLDNICNFCENEKVKVVSLYSGDDEAKFIADKIDRLKRDGFKYDDIAVLVRTASQTRAFEEVFIKESIPYKVVGGLKFYERAEIRDMLAEYKQNAENCKGTGLTVKTEENGVLLPGVPEFIKEIDVERGVFITPIPGFFSDL